MRKIPSYSVVIPVYNSRDTIRKALLSVVGQSVPPQEVIVVDDGSTDGSPDFVEGLALPLVRVVRQANAGPAVARNRGIAESRGEYVCFLDADDWWDEDFLHHITNMIKNHPGAGIYCTGYWIHRRDGVFLNEHKIRVVSPIPDVFRTAAESNLCRISACVMPREAVAAAGGFPAGMHQGEDVCLWARVALSYPVCYSPARLSNYNMLRRTDRLRAYVPAEGGLSFLDLRKEGNDDLNEFLACHQISLGIMQSASGHTAQALKTERDCAYTRRYRGMLCRLRLLNRLPVAWRGPLLAMRHRVLALFSRMDVLE